MTTTQWKFTSCLKTFIVTGDNPERIMIPEPLLRRAWPERLFNLTVKVERLHDSRWEQVFNWPARKLRWPSPSQ